VYKRNFFIKKIQPFIGKPIIKVLTGMRRIGKSSLLKLLIEEISLTIPDKDSIIYINMESLQWGHLKTEKDLYDFVMNKYNKTGQMLSLFIDEIQEIKNWEKAVNSFLSDKIADIYITGSNAHLLSSELATLLSGRYVQFPIYGLSLTEYKIFRQKKEIDEELFLEYLKFGGLPGIHHGYIDDDVVSQYISSIFDTILLRDVIAKNKIRNIALLEKIVLFLLDNIGNVFSAKKVSDFLKKEQRNIGVETVYNYLKYLENAFLIHRVPRYDIKGKKLLEVSEKYFTGDIGLKYARMGYNHNDINSILENIVFLELKRRDYSVFVGKLDDKEIDFIAEKKGAKIYIQVCYLLASEDVIKREFSVLQSVKDNYPKYVISMDKLWNANIEGIIRMNIKDFLLKEEW